mmetsp:Transcript_13256/g.19065  ORF Transcript_13256/g.19065 Transcript_13256/m.19065 type:complete len:164 (-) Transcript_13256:125-616(-)
MQRRILRIVAAYRPEKDNPHRIRFTVGGNLIEYLGKQAPKPPTSLPSKSSSIPSYPQKEHASSLWIQKILRPLIHKGHVYVEIQKGMYGLPQASKIANDQLIKLLKPHGYTECDITPGLWKHATRSIQFCLVVDDFGIKYTDPDDVTHQIPTLTTITPRKLPT